MPHALAVEVQRATPRLFQPRRRAAFGPLRQNRVGPRCGPSRCWRLASGCPAPHSRAQAPAATRPDRTLPAKKKWLARRHGQHFLRWCARPIRLGRHPVNRAHLPAARWPLRSRPGNRPTGPGHRARADARAKKSKTAPQNSPCPALGPAPGRRPAANAVPARAHCFGKLLAL